ncbi:homocysteine S-methyltransferase family protein [Aeromonas rivipollensis]|uniref:homocysteine S-methyltransferase family protein n=1 Tax=Aeromonas rivipollensis TaxID=948519 RepID=UPI00259D5199|nr:homocysteine S-methyltransferase family protein [Aeromonas rivipollensis]MDM5057515.1 homocysteine S-methyltransferase family protein [Aeromonas rivipollensis]
MDTKDLWVLDGGMGRELARRGAPFRQPEWSALALMEAPETVREVHQAYVASGARVITTNSYALVPFHIGDERFAADGERLAALAGQLARDVADGQAGAVQVAGSLPPLFGSYRADLFEADRVRELATPLIRGLSPHVDIWLAETMSLIAEPLALKALLPGDGKPFWVSFTLEDEAPGSEPTLRSGERVADAVAALASAGVSAILFNCCQPEVIEGALKVASARLQALGRTDIRLGAYANAFPPQPKEATANDGLDEIRADLGPQDYLGWAERWRGAGASLIGGCCGIGPEHIQALSSRLR